MLEFCRLGKKLSKLSILFIMYITPFIEKFKYLKLVIIYVFDLVLLLIRKYFSLIAYDNEVIAIISFHKLGDTVFTIPAIREILRNFSDNKFIIFCFPESEPIYNRAFPEIETEIIDHNEFRFEERVARRSGRIKIRKYKPHIIYDLTGSIQSASLIFNIRAKKIIGINKEYFRQIYDVYAPIRNTPHIIDIYLDAIKGNIQIGNTESIKTFPIKSDKNNGRLLFHPLAGWASKQWGIDNFFELILQLSEYDRTLIIAESDYNGSIINILAENGVKIVESKTIERLMEIIESHSVFIGNDSGPAHIASYLGIPTFIIYGPTNPIFSVPYGKYHESIQKNIWCTPKGNDQFCYTDGGKRGCASFECMKQLTVAEVKDKLLDFLNKIEIKKQDTIKKEE